MHVIDNQAILLENKLKTSLREIPSIYKYCFEIILSQMRLRIF